MIGVHDSGFEPSEDPDAVRDAVARLEIPYPVVVDVEHEIWQLYGNLGWPARYLFNQEGKLFDYHYGEGGYEETELAIQELLGIERAGAASRCVPRTCRARCWRRRARTSQAPTAGRTRPARSGPCSTAAARCTANGRELTVDHPGCYELISHPRSTAGELELDARRRRPLPRGLLHAGAARRDRVEQVRRAPPAPSSSDRTQKPGAVGALVRPVAEERRLVHPAAGVEQAGAERRAPLAAIVGRQRAGAVGVAEDHMARASTRSLVTTSPNARSAGAAELGLPRGRRAAARAARG